MYYPAGTKETTPAREEQRKSLLRDKKIVQVEIGGRGQWYITFCKTHDEPLKSLYDQYLLDASEHSRLAWLRGVEEYVDHILEQIEKMLVNRARSTDLFIVRSKILSLRRDPTTSYEGHGEYPTSRNDMINDYLIRNVLTRIKEMNEDTKQISRIGATVYTPHETIFDEYYVKDRFFEQGKSAKKLKEEGLNSATTYLHKKRFTRDQSRELEEIPTLVLLLHNCQSRLAGVNRACLNKQINNVREQEIVDARVIHLAQPMITGAMGRYAKLPRDYHVLWPVLDKAATHEPVKVNSFTDPIDAFYHHTFPLDFNVVHKPLPDTVNEIMGYAVDSKTDEVFFKRIVDMKAAASKYVKEYWQMKGGEDGMAIIQFLESLDPEKVGSSVDSPYNQRKRLPAQKVSKPVFMQISPTVWNTVAKDQGSSARNESSDAARRDRNYNRMWNQHPQGDQGDRYRLDTWNSRNTWNSHHRSSSQNRYGNHYKGKNMTLDFLKSVRKHLLKPALTFKCLGVVSALEDGVCPVQEVVTITTPFFLNSSFWLFLIIFTVGIIISTLLCLRCYFGKDVYRFLERNPRIYVSATAFSRSRVGVDNQRIKYHYHERCHHTDLTQFPLSHIFYPCERCEAHDIREDFIQRRNRQRGTANDGTRALQPQNRGIAYLVTEPARDDQGANLVFPPTFEPANEERIHEVNQEVARAQEQEVPEPPPSVAEPEEEFEEAEEAVPTYDQRLQRIRRANRRARENQLQAMRVE